MSVSVIRMLTYGFSAMAAESRASFVRFYTH